jgi:hypothetical protein
MANETVTYKTRLVGTPSLTLGGSSPDGKANELSYLMLPVEFQQGSGRGLPGVLSIFATERAGDAPDAGLMTVGPGPTRMATIATSRTQFTELVYFIQAARTGDFELHAEEGKGRDSAIVSWSVSIELRNI